MGKSTYPQILLRTLKRLEPTQQASPKRLAELTGWPVERVNEVARHASEKHDLDIHLGRGGTIMYRGSDSPALYNDVARVITKYWAPSQGLKDPTPMHTAKAGTHGAGKWTHPDIVVAANPKKRDYAGEPKRLHSFEVETRKGFDIQSIYQAHCQGQGSDYIWVIGSRMPCDDADDPQWSRIMKTAELLQVGLFTYTKPGSWGTWKPHVLATRQHPTAEEREEFVIRAIGPKLRIQHGL